MTNDVDGDGRDPLLRQGGSQGQRSAATDAASSSLLAAPDTVAEDRHRPPARGPGPRRQVQVEEHLVDALDHRRPGPRPDRRDELLRGLVVRRNVLAEGDLAHRTGDEAEQTDVHRHGVERPGHPGLLVPGDARHVAQVEHRPLTARPQEEVGRRRRGRVELVADLLQDGRGTLRREDARRHDVRPGHPGLPRGLQGTEQVLAVLLQGGVVRLPEIEVVAEALEVLARLDRLRRPYPSLRGSRSARSACADRAVRPTRRAACSWRHPRPSD